MKPGSQRLSACSLAGPRARGLLEPDTAGLSTTSSASTTQPSVSGVGVKQMSLLLGAPFRSVVRRPFTIRSRAAHTYFQYVNDNTGVYGRKINFKYLDDAYNPAQMIPLTKQPVEQDQVFAMYSGLGTEPQTAVRDYLNGPRVPQVFVASGAATFQADFNKYPYTFSAIPASQGEALICAGHLLQQNPGRRHLTE